MLRLTIGTFTARSTGVDSPPKYWEPAKKGQRPALFKLMVICNNLDYPSLRLCTLFQRLLDFQLTESVSRSSHILEGIPAIRSIESQLCNFLLQICLASKYLKNRNVVVYSLGVILLMNVRLLYLNYMTPFALKLRTGSDAKVVGRNVIYTMSMEKEKLEHF